jgi:hypothetical protein
MILALTSCTGQLCLPNLPVTAGTMGFRREAGERRAIKDLCGLNSPRYEDLHRSKY